MFPQDEKQQGKSNLVWATSNFINSIIGSGIIGMPYALKQAGIGLGILLMVLVAVVTGNSKYNIKVFLND